MIGVGTKWNMAMRIKWRNQSTTAAQESHKYPSPHPHLLIVAALQLVDAARLVAVVDGVRQDREQDDQLLLGVFLALQGGVPRVFVEIVHGHGNQADRRGGKDEAADNKVRRQLLRPAVLPRSGWDTGG